MAKKRAKSPIAANLEGLAVARSLPCGRCGYDLRGLAAEGDCPECGESVRLTVIEVVDPAARRLPPVCFPVATGNAIVSICACLFLSLVCAILPLVASAPMELPIPGPMRARLDSVNWIIGAAAIGLLALVSLLPLMRMCRAGTLPDCRAGVRITSIGLAIWIAALAGLAVFHSQFVATPPIGAAILDFLAPGAGIVIALLGLKRLVPRLGQRSRAFRQAMGSRQRVNDLIAALAAASCGRLLMVARAESLQVVGRIVLFVALAMVVLGLGYLVRNAWWIRQALVAPPPGVAELLRPIEED